MRKLVVGAVTAVLLLSAAQPVSAAEEAVSSSVGDAPPLTNELSVGSAPVARMAVAAVASEETVTFSELPSGTLVTDQYQQRGIVFYGDSPFITADGANPTSPVLSGTPRFQGDVAGRFVRPDGSARTVDRLALDVGYIDTPSSVAVRVFDSAGSELLDVELAAGGIVTTTIDQVGMASFLVTRISDEPAGFAVDNVTYPTPAPTDVVARSYVALGDSYQSGQAAEDYEPGTDEDGGNGCRRSDNAYAPRLVDRGVVDLTLDFRACSGAVIDNVRNGQNGEGPQLDALGDDTRLVTVGIVGNDLDFGPTIQNCILTAGGNVISPLITWVASCQRLQGGDVAERIESLRSGDIYRDLIDLYREIRSRAPYARVVVVSYPEFFQPGGSGGYVGCQAIRSSDQDWVNEQIVTANSLIGDVAGEAGFEHVDMGDVLLGRQLCDDSPALEGIRLDDRNASFHPNSSGHSLMADRIADHLGQLVTPAFTVQQGETRTGTFTIRGSAFTLNTGWPGSDVVTTLVSPSGVRHSREDPNGADQANGPTWEYLTVTAPEPGVWTYEVFGADVDPGGEPVTLRLFDDVPRNQPPAPVITTTQTGDTVTFDATGTTDADGTVVDLQWDFADGSTASGPVVTHTFAPGTYDVTLTATDDDGAKGFGHTDELVQVGSDPAAATVYSGSSLTLTNSFSAAGEDADVLVDGDFRCDSRGHVAGDVTVLGAAYLTSTCRVDGTVWAAGGVTMDAAPRVGGDVVAVGAVRMQSTARVAGDVRTESSFTVTDGLSVEALRAKGSLGGTVTSGSAVAGPGPVAPAVVAAEPAAGHRVTPWDTWLREVALRAGAPAWSQALAADPGCTLASWSAGTSTVTVGDDTWVDARKATTGCGAVSLQGLTLRLSGDLTVVADGLQSTNGMRVVSADGEPHTLRVLVPGTIGAPTTAGPVTLLGTTAVDPAITVQVGTPGTLRVDGPADLTGVVAAGRVVATGAVTLRAPAGPEAR